MRESVLTWLASLRVRLIATYMLVTAISFLFLFMLLMRPNGPIEQYIMKREEDLLKSTGIVLGSTIPSPVEESDAEKIEANLKWTQRRCRNVLNDKLPNTRIRVLDNTGRPLTDSAYIGSWDDWKAARKLEPSLKERFEVRRALLGMYDAETRYDRDRPGIPYTICIAVPVLRTRTGTAVQRVGYVMYLDRPVETVRKDMQDVRRLMLFATLASLLVTVLVSILFANNLSSGLRAAKQIARGFADGQMDLRMREQGADEVGQLGLAFNQMAEALQRNEQLRRDLLADVSHELRTPLTAIAGCVDTLSDGALQDDPAAAEHFLGIIQRECLRLQRLVADILDLSRLQAGVVSIPREPIAILPIVTEAVEIALLNARQDEVNVVCSCPEALEGVRVLGNEDRLAQALRNLLDNAHHHSLAGGTITITLEATEEMVDIHVRDEGDGIPPEALPWVFDRFYRAGKGSKPGGTGLGLAIVREIMRAHEGHVTVESAVGQGTVFSLHLPRVQAEQIAVQE